MAYLLPEALKLSENPLMSRFIRSIVTTDEFAALVPFEPVDGTSWRYSREGELPATEFIPDSGVTTEESTGVDDVIEVQFRRLVGNMDEDQLANGVSGAGGGTVAQNRLLAKKTKATWRRVKAAMITGGHTTTHTLTDAGAPFTALSAFVYGPHLDSARKGPGSIRYNLADDTWQFREPMGRDFGAKVASTAGTITLRGFNPSYFITVTDSGAAAADGETGIYFSSSNNEFDGLDRQIPPQMVISEASAGTADAFDLSMLDELISLQKVRDGRAFWANSKQIENYYQELRTLGGIHPQHTNIPGYSGQVPTYRGIPILENDNVPTVPLNVDSSAWYLGSLNADEGVVLAAQTGGNPVAPDADPRVRPVLGFRIIDVGMLDEKDARRIRVKWTGSLALKSNLAVAVRRGVAE